MKKLLSALISVLLVFALASCKVKIEDTSTSMDPIKFNIVALKGPTAMGLVKLMNDAPRIEAEGGDDYRFTIAASADEITSKLITKEYDLACVPANLASILYNKTDGNIQVLAINTLGVLYIVDTDSSVKSIANLKGKTIAASGKGATPEYALRYILQSNGIDPDKDVTMDWKSEHTECVTALATNMDTIALLPQPFVTIASNNISNLNIALDLTEEWDKLDTGSSLITGVIVCRKDFIQTAQENIKEFLTNYANSVNWVNDNIFEAAKLIGKADIVKSDIAEKAIPYCNIVCISGYEMQEKLSGYLQVLADENIASVGGKMPSDDFYFK